MQFTVKSSNPATITTSCLVVGIHTTGNQPEITTVVDKASKKAITKVMQAGDITGKMGEFLLLPDVAGIRAKRLLLIGCGKKSELNGKKYSAILSTTFKVLHKYHVADAAVALADLELKDTDAARKGQLASQILEASQYHYSTTKSGSKKKPALKKLDLVLSDPKQRNAAKKGLELGLAIGKGMNVARELGNLPANICTPTYLADQAIALGKKTRNLSVKVLTEAQMKRLGMGSLLSVGHGSDEPSAFIIMEYKGTNAATKPNVLVGKGITFDTGGISLKPGNAMDEMKFDMCGAASVMGAMTTLCEYQPKVNVVGVIASAENMPSGRATKPGDVVTSMSGKTIEVLNTDAEGRLVLCDALTYVERFDPKTVIDIATLTGAVIVALGSVVSGMMSNDDDLADTLYQCGLDAQDPVWRLPIWDEYQKQLDSNFADIANIGGPKAGSITAACFLERFAKKYKWAHIDIAGTAWLQGAQKGATGRPVPLLVEYLLNN